MDVDIRLYIIASFYMTASSTLDSGYAAERCVAVPHTESGCGSGSGGNPSQEYFEADS